MGSDAQANVIVEGPPCEYTVYLTVRPEPLRITAESVGGDNDNIEFRLHGTIVASFRRAVVGGWVKAIVAAPVWRGDHRSKETYS